MCVGCDVPPARKTCGFVGHSARIGCSKCLTEFCTEKFGEKADYSNFDKDNWPPRTNDHHRSHTKKHRLANTKSKQTKIEHESGVRYSILLNLPYFDAPRMCIVDPMHNLFLGIAKKFIELLKGCEQSLFSEKFTEIQEKVDRFVTPKGLGRLPFKISSGFAGFTAEQRKNWTLFFSLYSLKGSIPRRHYQCWQFFAKACFLLCR